MADFTKYDFAVVPFNGGLFDTEKLGLKELQNAELCTPNAAFEKFVSELHSAGVKVYAYNDTPIAEFSDQFVNILHLYYPGVFDFDGALFDLTLNDIIDLHIYGPENNAALPSGNGFYVINHPWAEDDSTRRYDGCSADYIREMYEEVV